MKPGRIEICGHRVAVQIQSRNRLGHGDQVGGGLSEIVASCDKALQVKEMESGRVDNTVWYKCECRVVQEVDIEMSLQRSCV